MRRAWRKLNAARLRYETDPSIPTNYLANAYEGAEEIVGDVKEEPE
jgi:hypothetical protein